MGLKEPAGHKDLPSADEAEGPGPTPRKKERLSERNRDNRKLNTYVRAKAKFFPWSFGETLS